MCKKVVFSLFLFILTHATFAQVEKPIRLINCTQEDAVDVENCFLTSITEIFNNEFRLPENLTKENYTTNFSIVFLASKTGDFTILYISTQNQEIKTEVARVFDTFPKFQPATYNKHLIDKRFLLPYKFGKNIIDDIVPETKKKTSIFIKKSYENRRYNSPVNIPLTVQEYKTLSAYEFSQNTHTAVKPYIYQNVSKHIDYDSLNDVLKKDKSSWFGRKLWNENMLAIKGNNYWFHLDPIVDLQMGKDNSEETYTYNNTRGVKIEGGLNNIIGFSSTILESQGRFADYVNRYALFKKPISEAYAIVPSRDTSKEFKNHAFDYPMAMGYLSISPFDFINIQFGHDKNFIGEGYRSLFLSDVGAPYTFLKINTKFWKIQYTNLWTWLRDVNTETADDEPYKRKYMALHYLSWNATKNLNIGLFESVTWAKTPERGFDVHYLNPIIIYRALEYSNGSRAGNALIGLSANYRFKNKIQLYSQFVLDELTMEYFFKEDAYWANKYGFQLGAKYYDAFKIPNLTLQAEYNQVRPYTYSHSKPVLNYGHANQALAHLWESNFKEFTAIASYQRNRWFGSVKLITGIKGFDINSETDTFSYGGNIFRTSNDKNDVFGIDLGQGNKANILIGELQAGYLINPATNLKIFGSILYRDFKTQLPDAVFENKTTTWFNFGLRTDINNWYFDF